MDNATLQARAIREAEWSLSVILSVLGPEDGVRTGGYLCVCSCSNERNSFLIHDPIGTIPPPKQERCRRLSLEKVDRLISCPEHQLSWQSRNSDKDQFGGAVRSATPGNIFAGFSGLPELADEALVLHWMVGLGLLQRELAERYAQMSGNTYFARIPTRQFPRVR